MSYHCVATFLPDNERSPVSSGYRCLITEDGARGGTLTALDFGDIELVFPGDRVQARMIPTEVVEWYAGMEFGIFEGSTRIGSGTVTQVMKR